MTKVTVSASTEYDILIGQGILDSVGECSAKLIKGRNAVVVSDETTHELYFSRVSDSLTRAGFTVFSYVIVPGEGSKNTSNYIELLEFATTSGVCRDDVFVALGGGVVGDLTGFAAASFERGVDFIQIPTTILAAVDSSVGGKTAIDLKAGKNLAGAFHQPKIVLCDTDTMDTLSMETFTDGCGEIIKYAILGDKALTDELLALKNAFEGLKNGTGDGLNSNSEYKSNLELIIAKCVRMKALYVNEDEFDKGKRAYLNLGHTIGHAIELLSGYTVSHGHAVATGIVYAARAAEALSICGRAERDAITASVRALGFDTETEYSPSQLAGGALADKKRSGETITLVLPVRIGECCLKQVEMSKLEQLIVG